MRILFHTHSRRAFTTTLIGNLFELTQHHTVVLVTEQLAESTLALLRDKDRFPGLAEVVVTPPLEFRPWALCRANRSIARSVRQLFEVHRPDIVAGENDMMSLFDLYLFRIAKLNGLPTITFQSMVEFREEDNRTYNRLMHLYRGGRPASAVTRAVRLARYFARKELGHFLVHCALPVVAGLGILRGRSSYIKWTGASGMRDGDLNLVLSSATYAEYARRGVPEHKLGILRHPLERNLPRDLFLGPQVTTAAVAVADRPMLLVLLGFVTAGFNRNGLTPIPDSTRREANREILAVVREALPQWTVRLKPHPNWRTIAAVRDYLGALDPAIQVIDPESQVERELPGAAAILDLPPAGSTTLYITNLAYPDKPVIAADVLSEFYGDNYRDADGIEYCPTLSELRQLLQQIGEGKFRKRPRSGAATDRSRRQFRTANDALSALLSPFP